jgi:hypothetical protein
MVMKQVPRVNKPRDLMAMKELKRLEEPIRGAGDVVERVCRRTGIHWLVLGFFKARGKTCGCAKRRDKLNRWFPFRRGGR